MSCGSPECESIHGKLARVDDAQVLTSCQIRGIIDQQPVALGKIQAKKIDALMYGIWMVKI